MFQSCIHGFATPDFHFVFVAFSEASVRIRQPSLLYMWLSGRNQTILHTHVYIGLNKLKMTRLGIEPRASDDSDIRFRLFTSHPFASGLHSNQKSQVCFSQNCPLRLSDSIGESSNSVATPVMQSLKCSVATEQPGWPSRALEQTKNRLMWWLTFLSLTRHGSVGLLSFSVFALNQMVNARRYGNNNYMGEVIVTFSLF